MIKAVGKTPDGQPMILLGLSAVNVEKLKEGKPILVQLSELGLEGQVAIVYGDTEDQIARDMESQFSIGTKVDKRTADLFCVDCYGTNTKPLTDKCRGECDGDGPVMDAEGIRRHRKDNAAGVLCAVCKEPQFWTPSGICCKNGHGGADSLLSEDGEPFQRWRP